MTLRGTARLLLALALLGVSAAAWAAPVLDVGADYRLRGIAFTNPTYASEPPLGSDSTRDTRYASQRGRVYVKARLDPGIEIGTVLQSIGVAGSTAPLIGRYPSEDFTPFVENAYITANEFHGWPVNMTFGRQPYTWGTGMILADDGIGFDGARLDAGPFWGLRAHLFAAKAGARGNDVSPGDHDLYLGGLSYQWGIHNIRLGYLAQDDKSGTPYMNLSSTTPVPSGEITRQFIDLQVGGKLEKGAFYQAEYAMQMGKVNMPGGTDVTLSGSALTFEGGFDFVHPRYKRMILAFVFMQGSGDDVSTKNEDERFYPTFGHRYDGLERVGAGDLFAATPYSFYNEERAVVKSQTTSGQVVQTFPYDAVFSGLRTFGFRGSVNPWEPFTAGLEFYLYTARELPDIRNGSPLTLTDNALGREMVLSATYEYARRILFAVRWGNFWAAPNLNNVNASRVTLEASAKF